MRRLAIATIAVAALLPRPCAAQTTEWPEYSAEQRWDRAARFVTLGQVTAIAYAKAQNVGIEEFGRWYGDLFVPSWGQPGTYSPAQAMNGVRRNFLSWPAGTVEIVSETEIAVTARFSRPWVAHFGESGTWYGVTLEEYERISSIFFKRIADYHGLAYEERREGDSWVITYSRRR